jgi:hypothetical protein
MPEVNLLHLIVAMHLHRVSCAVTTAVDKNTYNEPEVSDKYTSAVQNMKTNEQTFCQTTRISNSSRAYHHVHILPLTHTIHLRSQISISKDHALQLCPTRQHDNKTPNHPSATNPIRSCLTFSRFMNERKHNIIHQPGHPTRSHTITPSNAAPPSAATGGQSTAWKEGIPQSRTTREFCQPTRASRAGRKLPTFWRATIH